MGTGIQLKSGSTNIYPVPYFPIGAIFMSTKSTSPGELYGGTWVQLTDRFLIGAGGSYSLNATGGESSVKLTESTTPSHTHTNTFYYGLTSGGNRIHQFGKYSSSYPDQYTYTLSTGASSVSAHNNMPPYKVVYMWRRSA